LGDNLHSIEGLLIDMDGILYRGSEPISGAKEFIILLQREGTPSLLLTNNSTRTPAHCVTKLAQMGIEVEKDDVLTSAQATALYMARVAPPRARVYVIGEEGLRSALREKGYALSEDAEFVVVGMDTHLTYEELKAATLLIRGGAKFIGTNSDKTFPSEKGIVPGNGAILAALEAATGIAPTVVGKPEPIIFELALAKLGTDRERTAIIGDRLETDVLGGQRFGLITILVLSGITTPQELENSPLKPNFVFKNMKCLHQAWLDTR